MMKKLLIIVLGLLIILSAVIIGREVANRNLKDKNPVASSAILEWLQQPAAVRYVGKHDRTYLSWIEYKGKIQMRFYDHKTKTFSPIETIDDLYPDYGIEAQDDHNAPSLLILPDGRLLIFYVVHDSVNAFFMKTSKNPEDISSWGPRKAIFDSSAKTTYNYPQAKRLENGQIFLFYRRGVFYRGDEYYKVSGDNGISWSYPVKIIDFYERGIYAFVSAKDNEIHLAWNTTGIEPSKKNIYYLYTSNAGASWKKRNGTNLTLPVKEKNADLIFDSQNQPAYVWDIVIDQKHRPYIVFAYKNDPDHEFRFSQWQDNRWFTKIVTQSALHYDSGHFFSGGIMIDPKNPYQVYLSKKRNKLEIESWVSSDQGRTWQRKEAITRDSLVDNFRPQVVQNYSSELRLIWSSGIYEGLVDGQWSGFEKVNLQSEITKDSIPRLK